MHISNENYNIILAMHFRLIYFLTYKWLGSGMVISSKSTCDELGLFSTGFEIFLFGCFIYNYSVYMQHKCLP